MKDSGEQIPGRPGESSLDRLAGLSPSARDALRARWVTTVDAFVSLAATEEGRLNLCKLLALESSDLEDLLRQARELLGEERFGELLDTAPGGRLGALFDEKQRPVSGEDTSRHKERP